MLFLRDEYISRQYFNHECVHQIPQANYLLNNDRPNCITELQIGLKHLKVSYLRSAREPAALADSIR